MQEFIKLRQGGMSVKEDALKFIQLSKYTPTIMADSRAKMNKFVMGVSDMVVSECHSAILIPSMDISRLMVHDQKIEESKLKKKNREVKRARTSDGNFSNARSDGQGQQKFKPRYSNQYSSNASPTVNKDRVPNPKPEGGNSGGSYVNRPNCTKCVKNHDGKFLAVTDVCYGCGKGGHQLKNFLTLTAKGREGKQAPPSGSNSNAKK
ncbi:uncharacterized protein LOC125809270 [Solanum verrucosum]|uniref:uncharacterized protein LOC125809270 n=1 Tax=Solanum verrucosum TaxID=315347 RepID=UPI0020D05ADC|nr:uncharacterized protein LOC125809270 [Solanum verrucosum]